eukprot:gene7036-11201_t
MQECRNLNNKPLFFEAVYYDRNTREAFEEFLASEYNLEPWEFIKEFDDYKTKPHTTEETIQKALRLISLYINPGAKKELNISNTLKNDVLHKFKECEQENSKDTWLFEDSFEMLFSKIRTVVYNQLAVDSYLRFVDTEYYLKLEGKKTNEVVDLLPLRNEAKERKTSIVESLVEMSLDTGGYSYSDSGIILDNIDIQSDDSGEDDNSQIIDDEEIPKFSLDEIIKHEVGRKYFEKYLARKSNIHFKLVDFLNEYYFFIEISKVQSEDSLTCANLLLKNFFQNENFVKQLFLIEMNASTNKIDFTMKKYLEEVHKEIKSNQISSDIFDPIANTILSFLGYLYERFIESDSYSQMLKAIHDFEQLKNLKTTTLNGPIAKYLNVKEEGELINLINHLRSKSGIKGYGTFLYQFKKYERCFKGCELFNFLRDNFFLEKEEIFEVANQLIEESYLHHILNIKTFQNDNNIYRFSVDDDCKVLNMHKKWSGAISKGVLVTQKLMKNLLDLLSKFKENGIVNYSDLGKSDEFKDHCNALVELQSLQVETFQDSEQVCGFLNIFNLLLIHSYILNGSFKNSLEKTKFYSCYKYNIGGLLYSLNDIEHGILKCNTGIPGSKQKEYFSKNDKRSDYTVKYKDLKIHFSLEYTLKSFSRITVYTQNNYTNFLNLSTACFIDQEVSINLSKYSVELPTIFKWYSNEFGDKSRKMMAFVRKYCTDSKLKDAIETLIKNDQKFHFKYSTYQWSINSE